jgi:hydroxymethylpyrimidine pyrophosphatase-like HAD family hydrolase
MARTLSNLRALFSIFRYQTRRVGVGSSGNLSIHVMLPEHLEQPLPTPSSISLIITDVDGTLLTSSYTIHPRTLSAFRALRKRCPTLPIVIASGKQYESCRWIREILELDVDLREDGGGSEIQRFPAIHCNGSLIYTGGPLPIANPDTQFPPSPPPLIEKHTLPPESVLYLIKHTRRYGVFLFTTDEAILVNGGEGVNEKDWCGIGGKYDSCVRNCTGSEERENMVKLVREGLDIVKVTICADESDLEREYLPSILLSEIYSHLS